RSLPSNPVKLQGNTVPEPKAIVTALKNNWNVHILLNALSTNALILLGSSSRSQNDSDHSLAVKDGVLTVASPSLDAKREPDMSLEDWIHAWPRLVRMISVYLPGPSKDDISAAWEVHFKTISNRLDFFVNFKHYLLYDIRVRQSFVHNQEFNPDDWQEEVWNAIGRERNISDFHGSLSQPVQPRASGSSFRGTTAPPRSSRASGSSSQLRPGPSNHKCIFCGSADCRARACGLTQTSFIKRDSSGLWATAANEQVCFRYNGARGCPKSESECGRKHLCTRCGQPHPAQNCA
ncbi:hypothetical protein DEU56DRAFT_709772, partial [Suillus clintonianus]|uniref:uncharacterized protein n=1 Tax=Suillus clintonianus TaxID=1904413 RepID=UPI001B87EABC